MYSKHKKVESDIQHYLANPKNPKQFDKRSFLSKYFVIILMPFILAIVLFLLLLLVRFDKYFHVSLMLPTIYVLCLYFCLVEYFTFVAIFKIYPEFAYVYYLSKSDEERKKDFSYDKAVQELYNKYIKRKTIARKRLKYKFFFGVPTFIFTLLVVLLGQPSASPVVIAVGIICVLYLLIDLVMSFGGKGD